MTYDAVVIGAGHNGLTAAALLARAGRRVLVLERRPTVGGLAASDEFHPGYRTAGVLRDDGRVRVRLIEGLRLSEHGLRFRGGPTPVLAAETDGPGLLLHRDPEHARAELAARSAADGERYAAFRAFVGRLEPLVAGILDRPPPDLTSGALRGARALLGPALALRRLGRRPMLEVLRCAPMCASDWLREWFEDGLLQAALAAPALSCAWAGPRSAGTAALLLLREAAPGLEVEGGGPALVHALRSACEVEGAEIVTGEAVRRITVAAGAVAGVELETGEVVAARQVLSTADPRRTFLDLLAPTDLPAGIGDAIAGWRCRGTTAVLHLALSGPLELAGRPGERFEAILVGEDLAELERAFDAAKYREMSEKPVLDVRVPTVADPSLAPDGHHVASVLVHHAPHDLRSGWNDEARERLTHACLERLAAVAPGLRDLLVGHELLTPADLETRHGLSGGHLHHGEHALDQLFWLRPDASCARHATPLRGLFVGGSGSHPGGGITCGPGALAAAAMLR